MGRLWANPNLPVVVYKNWLRAFDPKFVGAEADLFAPAMPVIRSFVIMRKLFPDLEQPVSYGS